MILLGCQESEIPFVTPFFQHEFLKLTILRRTALAVHHREYLHRMLDT